MAAAAGPTAASEDPRLKILFIGADPMTPTFTSLDVERELASLRALEASDADFGSAFTLVGHTNVGSDMVFDLVVDSQPDVLHFAGHGDEGHLLYEDGALGSNQLFARLVAHVRARLVVLNACNTATLGQWVTLGHDAVVVYTNLDVGDSRAISFTRRFYKMAAKRDVTIYQAFELAQVAEVASGNAAAGTYAIKCSDPNKLGQPLVVAAPHGAYDVAGRTELHGHALAVWSLAALPGDRLASGSEDATVHICDLINGSSITLSGHSSAVCALAPLSDGRLASGSWDGTVRVWNLRNGACGHKLEGHEDGVTSLVTLPNGRLASGSGDATVRVWDLGSGSHKTLRGHAKEVTSLALLGDGRLASGSKDNSVRVWDVRSEQCATTLLGHTDWVRALAVLDDGRLASGSKDTTVRVWDLRSGSTLILNGHTKVVTSLAALANGRLASGSDDTTVRVWDCHRGACTLTLSVHTHVLALAVLTDRRLASGSSDATVRVWNV